MSHTENILKMLPDRINQRNDLMVTPPWIAKDMINLLPDEVWNKDTTFLDPACKSGIYLHEIYLKLMDTPAMIQEFPDNAERRKHILQNQLYGIALNPMCQLMSTRTVYGTIQGDNNIILIDKYINIVKNKDTKFFKEAIKEQFGEMKVNVVIGNPPYQDSNGGGARGIGGITLYDKFVVKALELSDMVCMITKNNWFLSDILKSTRFEMINSGIQEIINYPVINEVFSCADVAVSIFLINKKRGKTTHYKKIENGMVISEYEADLSDISYILDSLLDVEIIKKVMNNNLSYSYHTLPNTPFGIRTNGKKSNGEFVNDSDNETEVNNIAVLYMDGSSKFFRYTTDSEIGKNWDKINTYKIVCGQQLNKNKSVITNIAGLTPKQVCSSSYGVIFYSDDMERAGNAYKYAKTKLFRFLVFIAIETVSTISASRFTFVPDQNFTSSSDIDWSQSIQDIDQQLYKKYNLTEEEIAYIEKTIKPMQ